jgi:hypothetical protein
VVFIAFIVLFNLLVLANLERLSLGWIGFYAR